MKKDVENAIYESLKHEKKLQNDENETPSTFVSKKQAKSLEHEDNVLRDENEDPKTFVEKS